MSAIRREDRFRIIFDESPICGYLLQDQEHEFIVQVSDAGIGIPRELLAGLFRIDESSTETQGSRFSFSLPKIALPTISSIPES